MTQLVPILIVSEVTFAPTDELHIVEMTRVHYQRTLPTYL